MFTLVSTQKDRKDVAFRPAHLVHTEALHPRQETENTVQLNRGAISSAAERHVHTVEVSGSIPLSPTIPFAIERRRSPVNGWVYFLLGDDTGRWKIGHAKDVGERHRILKIGCSEVLTIYGVLPAVRPQKLERAIHKRFAKLRLHGEWFDGSDGSIADFVDMYGYELEGTHRIWEEGFSDDLPVPRLAPAFRL